MITPTRLSYCVLALTIVLAGLLHLGTPLLVVLFAYFALRQLLYLTKRRWLALFCSLLLSQGSPLPPFILRVRLSSHCLMWPTLQFPLPAPGHSSARLNCPSPISRVCERS